VVAVSLDGSFEAIKGKYAIDGAEGLSLDANSAISKISLKEYPRKLPSADARKWLLGLTFVEFSVILLIITNAAASTVTREKEDGTLDLLLTSPITSRYYIWGKLRGLVSFVLPLVAVPVLSAFIFIAHDLLRWKAANDSNFDWIVLPESLLLMPGMLIIVAAFAAILGMQMSLRCRTTVRAVMSSLGIIVGACAAMGWCGFEFLSQARNMGDVAAGVGAFSPFTLLTLLIDPVDYAPFSFDRLEQTFDPGGARIVICVMTSIAIIAYAIGVWMMYKSMVKNFDMTIRRQAR
jgi:ABC-type Na+ efflux pump permease subunit